MRKYYDDEDDIDERPGRTGTIRTFLPPERMAGLDWVLAAVLAVLAFAGLTAFAFPGLSPDVWNDAAVAAGLRPPADLFPGFWRVLASALYLKGVAAGNGLLPWAGRICAALTAGCAYLFLRAALAFAQVAMLPPLWFWSWTDAVGVHSPYLLQMLMLCACGTVVCALTVLGCDACCRNHARLAAQRFAELRDDEAGTASAVPARLKRGGLVVFFVAAALLVAGVVPGRALTRTRQMLAIVEDYVREVVEECGPVHWIFTDGSFDARYELAAAARGKTLKALSMMADNAPYQQYLRARGVSDAEDAMSLAAGAPMALRSWVRDKPARLREMAVQLGFEVWKRDGKELPLCSGVLARPDGMDAADCAAGIARATALADRILALYVVGGPEKAAGRTLRDLFLFVQWRISRLARMRAERADRAGNTSLALKNVKLSDELDRSNESLKAILVGLERAKATTHKQVTPREGLQLALARADFVLARRYGEVILAADPDDPNANFGVGMSYYTQKQWARAEEYLRRCLVKKPKEPAVWNNLAMICLYTKRFDEAERHAKQALEIIPESAEVKDTLKEIAEARAKGK